MTERERSREKAQGRLKIYEPSYSFNRVPPQKKSRKTVTFNDEAEVKMFRRSDAPTNKGINDI